MATQRDDDDFDRWIAEKGGPEAVVAMIDDMKRRVADGSLPRFQDKQALLSYWADGGHEPT